MIIDTRCNVISSSRFKKTIICYTHALIERGNECMLVDNAGASIAIEPIVMGGIYHANLNHRDDEAYFG